MGAAYRLFAFRLTDNWRPARWRGEVRFLAGLFLFCEELKEDGEWDIDRLSSKRFFAVLVVGGMASAGLLLVSPRRGY